MEHKGHIGDMGQYSANHVAQGIQDLLICAEMMVAAVAFFFAFPLGDFVQHSSASAASAAAAGAMVGPAAPPRSRFSTLR